MPLTPDDDGTPFRERLLNNIAFITEIPVKDLLIVYLDTSCYVVYKSPRSGEWRKIMSPPTSFLSAGSRQCIKAMWTETCQVAAKIIAKTPQSVDFSIEMKLSKTGHGHGQHGKGEKRHGNEKKKQGGGGELKGAGAPDKWLQYQYAGLGF